MNANRVRLTGDVELHTFWTGELTERLVYATGQRGL